MPSSTTTVAATAITSGQTASLSTDILIVGAGPAGCAAAITLAQAGRRVLLIDQHDFPRDKTCGDGLIPDSMHALERLGVLSTVRQAATTVKGVACHGPKGGTLYIPGDLAVLPRKALDQCLFERAKAVGATAMTGVRYLEPIKDLNGRTAGACVDIKGQRHEIMANWTVLATGATVNALQATGLCSQTLPSAMALRAYVHHPDFIDENGKPIEHLHISWHKSYAPGYGWVFPCPNGVYNIGVGLYGMHETGFCAKLAKLPGLKRLSNFKPKKLNLAQLFKQFSDSNPLAKRLLESGTLVSEIKGAPLRCSLEGAKPAAPGILVTGEAMGSTYALTGEGIGKAMETGILSAQALLDDSDDTDTCRAYEQMLKDLAPKFSIYQQANKINRAPWLIDLAIARGNKSPRLVKRMSMVLEEKANPAKLFTFKGAWKFLTE
jgi:menaquinone-9 beta-reductase